MTIFFNMEAFSVWVRRAPSGHYDDHPRNAEAVGNHAEARRKESLRERHLDVAALGWISMVTPS
jgi:hypothetical protein